ncbi:hypothetical protein CL619_01155 [archaeon]|nr:hypothetical protein [archaeon]|tara:strand:+ start:5077 stop:5979 length:903 start_codon:yes stop_codon:yes gene_type:complete
MRIHHYVLIALGFFLIYFGLFSSAVDQDLGEVEYIILDDLVIGETTIPDNREVMLDAKPIFIEGNSNEAVLIFHGYLASPQEVAELAEYLGDKNYTVLAPLMSGHGSHPEALAEINFEDWQSDATTYYQALDAEYDTVHVIGFSLGSLSALYLAEQYELDSVTAIGPPFYIGHEMLDNLNLSNVFLELAEYVPTIPNPVSVSDTVVGRELYDEFPLESVIEILEYCELVESDLALVTEKTLLIHGQFDTTADPEGSILVYDSISSEEKELVEVASLHPVLMGIHKEEVFEETYLFLEEAE